jgi:hypothetical protein
MLLLRRSRHHSGPVPTYTSWIPVLQLWDNRPLHQGLPPSQIGQLTKSRGIHSESVEGPTEGSSTADWPHQLHHCRGDPHWREVLAGMFSLHDQPIIILFNSGAPHDFMISTCAKKAKLSLVAMEAAYVTSTSRSRVDADQIVRRFPLELAGQVLDSNVIILSGQGIDVILGMS